MNREQLHQAAERLNIPVRTLDQVKAYMAEAQNSDTAAARLMLRHGRMTDDARAWLSTEYPQSA